MKGKRISSHLIYLGIPASALGTIFFGFMSIALPIQHYIYDHAYEPIFIKAYILLCGITACFVIWLYNCLKLATYIEDQGGELLIKRRKTQETVPLANIKYLKEKPNSTQIVFVTPNSFGSSIAFACERNNIFVENEILANLQDRIYKAHINSGNKK